MRPHPCFLIGWLLAATVLLSLVGLTAEPLPVADAVAGEMIHDELENLEHVTRGLAFS